MSTISDKSITSPVIDRQKKLSAALKSNGFHSLILNAGPSLVYLTGLHFHLSERPVLVFLFVDKDPIIVLPELELEKLKDLPFSMNSFAYGEDPSTWDGVFKRAIQSADLHGKQNGVEPKQLRLLEYSFLGNAASTDHFITAEDIVAKLRMRKDEDEIASMRIAARIAEEALNATLPYIKISMSEKELASELTLQLFRAGCDPQVPFSPIVSSGLNSANPHAMPSDRKLSPGDLLVIDWGASHNGYFSDITRTFAIGKLIPEFANIYEVVMKANAAGRDAAQPGIPAEAIDQATRSVIESAGCGEFFTHRTGHGLGMEGHEEPYIRAGNKMLLEPGMTFTIEPGIYLPGRNGVRIEDDVAITPSGSECLTSLPRDVVLIE